MKTKITSYCFNNQMFITGWDTPDSKSQIRTVKEITKGKDGDNTIFTIVFTNGEELIDYPVPPFNYDIEIIKEEDGE